MIFFSHYVTSFILYSHTKTIFSISCIFYTIFVVVILITKKKITAIPRQVDERHAKFERIVRLNRSPPCRFLHKCTQDEKRGWPIVFSSHVHYQVTKNWRLSGVRRNFSRICARLCENNLKFFLFLLEVLGELVPPGDEEKRDDSLVPTPIPVAFQVENLCEFSRIS